MTLTDNEWMARALQLAARGCYTTHPNPNVGCVLVRDGAGKIIGVVGVLDVPLTVLGLAELRLVVHRLTGHTSIVSTGSQPFNVRHKQAGR